MRRVVIFSLLSAASLGLMAGTAGAERAPKSNGVGVCISQVAIDPSLLGAASLGEAARELAGPELPAALDGDRNACGEPPGPGHLG